MFRRRKCCWMHSSLPLTEPLGAIANTKQRQSQTTLTANLAQQRWKKTVAFAVLWALQSAHPEAVTNRGVATPLATTPLFNAATKCKSINFSSRHRKKIAGDLKSWKLHCFFPAKEKSDSTSRKLILQEKVSTELFWWDSKKLLPASESPCSKLIPW